MSNCDVSCVFSDDAELSDEPELLQTWFKLVLEKNKLQRYESELMVL